MKPTLAAFLLCAVPMTTPALANLPADSPLIGHWVLDVDSLPMPAEARPRSVNLDFDIAAGGKWKGRVEIVDQNGTVLYSESTLTLDGTPGRASGTYWVDVVAAKMPAPNVLVMQFVYEGIPRSTRVYSLNEEGSVLTETESYFKEGTPILRTAVFNRTSPKP